MMLVLGVAVAIALGGVLAVALNSRVSNTVRAQVHIDDLVIGRVPPVCAITGEPTSQMVQVDSSRGGFEAWWLLLLFLGPIGIAAIAVLYVLGARTERVAGILFISAEALRHYNGAVSLARRTTYVLVVLVLGAVGGLVLLDPPSTVPVAVLAALGGLAVVVLLGANLVAPLRWVDLRLDGSGRWVTIERCHPAFARAVRQSYQDRDPSFR